MMIAWIIGALAVFGLIYGATQLYGMRDRKEEKAWGTSGRRHPLPGDRVCDEVTGGCMAHYVVSSRLGSVRQMEKNTDYKYLRYYPEDEDVILIAWDDTDRDDWTWEPRSRYFRTEGRAEHVWSH